jgi:hypothetical protein
MKSNQTKLSMENAENRNVNQTNKTKQRKLTSRIADWIIHTKRRKYVREKYIQIKRSVES